VGCILLAFSYADIKSKNKFITKKTIQKLWLIIRGITLSFVQALLHVAAITVDFSTVASQDGVYKNLKMTLFYYYIVFLMKGKLTKTRSVL
jgi:hypothetical protein